MSIIVATLIAWILMASCSATRHAKTSTQKDRIEAITQSEIRSTQTETTDVLQEVITKVSDRNITTEWKIYDTRQPIDSATGKPPLIAEGTTKDTSTTETQANINQVVHEETAEQSKDSISTEEVEHETSVEEVEKENPMEEAATAARNMAIAAAIITLIVLILRKRNG